MKYKKKAGRPKLKEGVVFDTHITSTVNKNDALLIYKFADDHDVSLSNLIRTATLKYIKDNNE